MTTYIYGEYKGAKSSGKVTQRAWIGYDVVADDPTTYTIEVSFGVYMWNGNWSSIDTTCGLTGKPNIFKQVTKKGASTEAEKRVPFYQSETFTYTKEHDTAEISLSAVSTVKNVKTSAGGSSVNGKKSTATLNFVVPAKTSYTISYNANGGVGVPEPQTKWHGETAVLSELTPTMAGHNFLGWATTEEAVTAEYLPSSNFNVNANTVLYAVWGSADPPRCSTSDISLTINGSPQTSDSVIRNFTDISCDVSNIYVNPDRTIASIKMQIAGVDSNVILSAGTLTINGANSGVPAFSIADDGEQTVYIIMEDSEGAIGTYPIGRVTISPPEWNCDVQINETHFPSVDANGNAIVEEYSVWNNKIMSYEVMSKAGLKYFEDGSTWGFTASFDEDHVSDPMSLTPNVNVKVTYKHYDSNISASGNAFFTTSRNQNYSNGIYNVIFVGSVDNSKWTEFTSRVWWSKINDPLYFPDTNYIEVGSNDTSVEGLTKVGDYLAVVKQSKTTDTAIFLLYPTSFEEETTYAVKQGVQGVGALSRYSFNILGDETLFLSPKGVVAIVASEDEEHRVQNRSYFIDKRLLAEDAKSAYSFVYDGKYFLSVGNGHCYVLDGNQRNSWGNNRTVLVYECYYLDNVPANCFAKYKDDLVFSDGTNLCMFNDGYIDAYDDEGNVNVPVKAEWSTIFDDDGSLHYYKTMQKKGNLVSILPLENQRPYKMVAVSEETFNANKTKFFVLVDGTYTQCKEEDVYSQTETYYVENRNSTKVLVRKDDKEPVEIERKFGLQSDIPCELFVNKKFKKYKRLQFILRNEADEDFGVDEIVKNYTVGNYAKK